MTNKEIHDELTLLGVSSEVHALVDDLDLDFGRSRPAHKPYRPLTEFPKHVYKPKTAFVEVQGRLFEDDNLPLRKVRRVPLKKTKRVCGLVAFRSVECWKSCIFHTDV